MTDRARVVLAGLLATGLIVALPLAASATGPRSAVPSQHHYDRGHDDDHHHHHGHGHHHDDDDDDHDDYGLIDLLRDILHDLL